MFRDDLQRSRVCRTLLSHVRLADIWQPSERAAVADVGPGWPALEEAHREAAGYGSRYSHAQRIVLRMAMDLWNGSMSVSMSEILSLPEVAIMSISELLRAIAVGSDPIDVWLKKYGQAEGWRAGSTA